MARVRPLRVLSFDKTTSRNWAVPWHQDRLIAVAEKQETAGITVWTTKAGVPHCEAPVALLETMLTVRWHLDPSGPEDGGLRVMPGSHRLGRLSQTEIRALLTHQMPCDLAVPAGGVLLMCPLLVHGSRRRTTAGRRRVLHVELACGDPPAPLGWFYRSKNSNSR